MLLIIWVKNGRLIWRITNERLITKKAWRLSKANTMLKITIILLNRSIRNDRSSLIRQLTTIYVNNFTFDRLTRFSIKSITIIIPHRLIRKIMLRIWVKYGLFRRKIYQFYQLWTIAINQTTINKVKTIRLDFWRWFMWGELNRKSNQGNLKLRAYLNLWL